MDTNTIINFAPYLLIIAVFYFLIMRPQAKKRKEEKEFADSLKVGSKVITTSGIHGKVNQINADKGTVMIETGAGKMTFERSAISAELSKKLNEKVITKEN
ncbi:preprotein translocase subunit YajC [Nonlabens dokdonensis]|uniref:Sec translocon accessory complex subunit YajC n=2 Tax=Nonlabens dokdonensis TaxID=328515 RepID=L7W6W1_NONDD|nr:preprotein translocase subunit YajC [Nonlabens dokdonensis]AGC75531.1 preprotein translocase, YajC subunit [Nonlabens dokdonensis DSW-6]PZX43226.1 preprotein translocase subunit YajC [Nonlabens dokdonensis]